MTGCIIPLLVSLLLVSCGTGVGPQLRTNVSCNLTGTWSIVDNYQSTSEAGAHAHKIVSDSNGVLWVSGLVDESNGGGRWIVRKSMDGGTSWSTALDYAYVSGKVAERPHIVAVTPEILVLSGSAKDASDLYHIVTLRSTDAGVNWTVVDDFNLLANNQSHANNIIHTGSTVLVVGSGAVPMNRWLVRRSTDEGATWTTSDNYRYDSASLSANAWGGTTDSNGTIYVTGNAINSSNIRHWIVRKSVNYGTSWSLFHDFTYTGATSKVISGLAMHIHPNGIIYDVGEGQASGTDYHWITRSTSDGGTTWTTVDDYQKVSGKNAFAVSGSNDRTGIEYVAGYAADENNVLHWIIRQSADGVTWTTSDDFQLIDGKSSRPRSIILDRDDNLFVAGEGADENGKFRWLVRKMLCEAVQTSNTNLFLEFIKYSKKSFANLKTWLLQQR